MKKSKRCLFFILFFALFLRLYRLDSLELFGDELDVGYHAYSLWTTGRDYMGQKLPFYIHSFSEWRAPLLMYLTAPFVGALGLNEWSVRLPSVVFGVFSIYLLYYLIKILTKDDKLALISAFILTITPWHIHYSRVAFEATLLLALVLAGTVCFLREKWFFAIIGFVLSLYTYNTANIFVPIWILVLALVFSKKLQKVKKKLLSYGLLFFLLVLPLGLNIFCGESANRFKLISIFNNPETIDKIVFKRNTGLGPSIERIFYNKATGWGKELLSNYLTAFSPQFLFLTGDPNPRHNPPVYGELHWLLVPFLLIGIWRLLNGKDKAFKKIVFSWLLLAPIASSLTIGGGNQATRLFLMLPPLAVLISLGIKNFSSFLRITIYGLLIASIIFYSHNYFIHYPKESYKYWHYGYKQAMTFLRSEEKNYDRIFINNSQEPVLLRYLFWTEKDPAWFQNNFQGDQIEENFSPGFNGFALSKAVFGNINREDKLDWLKTNLNDKSLYLAFQLDEVPGDWNWEEEPPEGLRILKTVYDPWEEPMIYWLTKE